MIRPDFLDQHPDAIVRALGTVAWHRETLEAEFDTLAGDVAEAAGLDRAVVIRGLADVAEILDRWVDCCYRASSYALAHGIAKPPLLSWLEWGEAERDVLAADARSDLERLVRDARPAQRAS
jgi:hypothetical protein